jgi:ubiquinone/menaquinone biosynthesis C-methylase UbiE
MTMPSYAASADQARIPRVDRRSLKLRCPSCFAAAGELKGAATEGRSCLSCGYRVECAQGILRAVIPERRKFYDRFLTEYSTIRKAEGRGSDDPECYLALPYRDLTGNHAAQWAIRGKTYRYFEERVLPKFESGRPLDILDLGAGNGWMSYRLARRKHHPVAVDILTDPLGGLGAARHFHAALNEEFPLVEAEFDRLPFADAQFDLAIFNSSIHYSSHYHHTLNEAGRCLRPSGRVVILDSPIYKKYSHGDLMRSERHREFEARYGTRSDSIPSVEFLHQAVLEELANSLDLSWEIYKPWYGWKWALRPWKARLKRQRPPSRFWILVATWTRS